MKVVVAGQNYYVRGGSDKVMFDHIRLMNEAGLDAIPFAAHSEETISTPWSKFFPRNTANLQSPGPADVAKFMYSFSAKRSVSELLDEINADLFHCHIYYGKLTASILSEVKRRHIPLVQTLHEYKLSCPVSSFVSNGHICEVCTVGHYNAALIKRCNRGSLARSAATVVESYINIWLGGLAKFDLFIAVSDFQRLKLIEHGVPPSQITRIYNPVEVPDLCAGGGWEHVTYFGRLESTKGLWTLIKAFESMPHHRLVVAGTGSIEADLQKYCVGRNLRNITFVGHVSSEHLDTLLKRSICTVVPSESFETFGLSAAESLARGVPVVASRIGALPEVVTDEVDSILFEPGEVYELVAAVERIAGDRSLARALGQAGRKNMERFSPKRYQQEMLKVYKGLR